MKSATPFIVESAQKGEKSDKAKALKGFGSAAVLEIVEGKATLVFEISKAIKKKKLTQTQAASIFCITQPKLSALLNGHFRGYSIERLMHFLNNIGIDVDIVLKSTPRNRKARVNVIRKISFRAPMAAKQLKRSKRLKRVD